MAHLNRRGEDRGQVILVAAFLLAVAFVVLALVVNSAIFTENMATRNDVPGSHDALDYRTEVQASAGEALVRVNANSSLDETDLEETIEALAEASGTHQSTQGRLVNVSFDRTEEDGVRIAQTNASRNFTSVNGADDWSPTTDSVESVRNFEINVTSLNAFSLVANDTDDPGTEDWRMEVDESGGDLTVTVFLDGANEGECAREHDGYTVIDVTAGTVGGEPCVPLGQQQDAGGTEQWFAANIDDDYRVEFQDSDEIEGTYSFVLADGTAYDGAELDPDPDSGLPYHDTDAIYSIILEYAFYTSSVGYETEIRVAPGEVPS